MQKAKPVRGTARINSGTDPMSWIAAKTAKLFSWLPTPRETLVAGLAFLGVAGSGGIVYAHNLDAGAVYVYFDTDAQALLDARIADDSYSPPEPLLRPGDELGLIVKALPNNGTDTGVGGYTTFYVPNGVQVIDAAFVIPGDDPSDGISGWDRIPAHGQAAMPSVGAGGDSTVSLVGYSRGPNILGVTSTMVDAGNANLGTLPGVYGDIGIFYSTDPSTAFGSYVSNPADGIAKAITSNSGDTIGNRTELNTALN